MIIITIVEIPKIIYISHMTVKHLLSFTNKLVYKIALYCRMIKIEHSIFALPLALASFVLACQTHGFSLHKLIFVILAMVSARSAAMGFNRLADAEFDKLNPRTKNREIPKGKITSEQAVAFVVISSLIFVYSAFKLNNLCFYLSPVVLLILFFYSYTKRFTIFTHFFLGISLGLSPLGAWIAVSGQFSLLPFILSSFVILWVAGFDIIYACQDMNFDRKIGLFSVPVAYGRKTALKLSFIFHSLSIIPLIILGMLAQLGVIYYVGVCMVALLLLWEHLIINKTYLTKLNTAFFTINAWIGIIYFLFFFIDITLLNR